MSMIELGFFLVSAVTAIGWVVASHFWVEWYYRVLAAVSAGLIPVVLAMGISRRRHQKDEERPDSYAKRDLAHGLIIRS